MRKMRPTDIRSELDAALQDVQTFYAKVLANLKLDSDVTFLSRNTIIAAATLWESFVNNLFIAYINRNNSQLQIHLNNAFEEDRTEKQSLVAKLFVSVRFPKHMSVDTITDLIDKNGNNLTFPNYDELRKGAKTYLAIADHAGIIGLSSAQQAIINLWIALRNHIAHDSQRSYDAMNLAMQSGALHQTGLKREANKIRNVGAYLKAKPSQSPKRRVEIILYQMKVIAARL